MDVQFVTSVAPIVRDTDTSRSFYVDALGLRSRGPRRRPCVYTPAAGDETLRSLASF